MDFCFIFSNSTECCKENMLQVSGLCDPKDDSLKTDLNRTSFGVGKETSKKVVLKSRQTCLGSTGGGESQCQRQLDSDSDSILNFLLFLASQVFYRETISKDLKRIAEGSFCVLCLPYLKNVLKPFCVFSKRCGGAAA